MLSRLLSEIVFYSVHLVYFIIILLKDVCRRCHLLTKTLWNLYEEKVTKSEIAAILNNVSRNYQNPKHIVIIVDTNRHTLSNLARVLIWSLIAGVPFVSFYDITGLLVMQEEKLFLEVERHKKGVPGCIKWSQKPDLNGYNNGSQSYTVSVTIFKRSDGKENIAQCVQDIAENRVICDRLSNEYTAQELDKAFRSSIYSPKPDPDLILYTGPLCCTHGFLPWHIRLSEFIQLSPDNSISVYDYINSLCKFSKCDQRLGK